MLALATLDWLVIAAYFLALFGLAAWVIRKKNNSPASNRPGHLGAGITEFPAGESNP